MENEAVLLGVPKSCQTTEFEKDTCFLGGRPTWYGEDRPDTRLFCCPRCNSAEKVVFLFQCATSYEEDLDRFLYLLVCVKEDCLRTPDGWILLRSLVRKKPLQGALKVKEKQPIWEDFGTFEDSWNSNANKDATLTSSEFEQLFENWTYFSLSLTPKRETCSSTKYRNMDSHLSSAWNSELCLPQILLEVVEEAQNEKEHEIDPHIQFLRTQFYQNAREQTCEDFDVDGMSFFAEIQKEEWRYYKRMEHCPNQCVRYQFNGSPLITPWSKWNKAMVSKIPRCQSCDSERVFELQLMSQFLYYLKMGAKKSNIQIPFLEDGHLFMSLSTILVYTCSKDCKAVSKGSSTSSTNYYREYVLPIFETFSPSAFSSKEVAPKE
ncbi:hypothetical protein Gasu2_68750 [Galdieria sulphuraria]|nr:hypothetical protein Gasu2_68750 [Galdieria sulphuraria]